VNWILIGICVLVFLLENALERSLGQAQFQILLIKFGVVPALISFSRPASFLTLFSSMFLHGSWFHLLSNMWILYIFGDNVEERLGSLKYLGFYLISGVVAGLTQVVFSSNSVFPTVGASGAIAGVLGAYIVSFPRARVLTLLPLFIVPWFVEIPAVFFLGLWFLSQLPSALLSLGAMGAFGGVAWWAHIGGFVFGALAVHLLARPRAPAVGEYWDDYRGW
jgi:membrane associated rhomboid family serine protease